MRSIKRKFREQARQILEEENKSNIQQTAFQKSSDELSTVSLAEQHCLFGKVANCMHKISKKSLHNPFLIIEDIEPSSPTFGEETPSFGAKRKKKEAQKQQQLNLQQAGYINDSELDEASVAIAQKQAQ